MLAENVTNEKPFPKLAILDFAIFIGGFSLLFAFYTAVASQTPTDLGRHPDLLRHVGVVYALNYGFAFAALATFVRQKAWREIEITAGIYLALISGLVALVEMVSQIWKLATLDQWPNVISGGWILSKLMSPIFCAIILLFLIRRVNNLWKYAFALLSIYFAIITVQGACFVFSSELVFFIVRYYPLLGLFGKVSLVLASTMMIIATISDNVKHPRTTWMNNIGTLLMLNLILFGPLTHWFIMRTMWPD